MHLKKFYLRARSCFANLGKVGESTIPYERFCVWAARFEDGSVAPGSWLPLEETIALDLKSAEVSSDEEAAEEPEPEPEPELEQSVARTAITQACLTRICRLLEAGADAAQLFHQLNAAARSSSGGYTLEGGYLHGLALARLSEKQRRWVYDAVDDGLDGIGLDGLEPCLDSVYAGSLAMIRRAFRSAASRRLGWQKLKKTGKCFVLFVNEIYANASLIKRALIDNRGKRQPEYFKRVFRSEAGCPRGRLSYEEFMEATSERCLPGLRPEALGEDDQAVRPPPCICRPSYHDCAGFLVLGCVKG